MAAGKRPQWKLEGTDKVEQRLKNAASVLCGALQFSSMAVGNIGPAGDLNFLDKV